MACIRLFSNRFSVLRVRNSLSLTTSKSFGNQNYLSVVHVCLANLDIRLFKYESKIKLFESRSKSCILLESLDDPVQTFHEIQKIQKEFNQTNQTNQTNRFDIEEFEPFFDMKQV
jgi:hypothetical protein